MENLLFRSLPILFQVFGSSLKILPVAAWDELHILLTSFRKIRWPINLALQVLIVWQIYMILVAIVNGYGSSLVFFRYVLVFFSLFLLQGYFRRLIKSVSKNAFMTVAYAYLCVSILLYVVGTALNLPVAWWQEFLWVGTAYSAYVIYLLVGLVFMLSNILSTRLIFIITAYGAGIAMDSRLALFLITTLIPLIGFGLAARPQGLSPMKWFYRVVAIVVFSVGASTIIAENIDLAVQNYKSVEATFVDLMSDDNRDNRDVDRQQNLLAVVSLFDSRPINFFIGTGLTSHQYELSEFLDTSSDGRIRPTGVPAIVFDGGIIYLTIILMCALNSVFKALVFGINGTVKPWVSLLWMSLIFNTLVVVFLTNTTDLMLWWAVLLSGSIINKDLFKIHKPEKSVDIVVTEASYTVQEPKYAFT